MIAALGTSWGVFIGIVVVMFGFGAFMTGQALADTWRPIWQVLPYSLLLALGARFLIWSLFEGRLVDPGPLALTWGILLVMALAAFRMTQARRMVVQYPWLYERAGLFGWRGKRGP